MDALDCCDDGHGRAGVLLDRSRSIRTCRLKLLGQRRRPNELGRAGDDGLTDGWNEYDGGSGDDVDDRRDDRRGLAMVKMERASESEVDEGNDEGEEIERARRLNGRTTQ